MEYEFSVKYSEALIKQAHLQFWKRKHGFDAVLSVIFLLGASYVLFFMEITEWYVVVFFTIALIFTIAVYSIYFIWRRQSFDALHAMKTPEARWKFTEEKVQAESDVGKTDLKWSAIKKIWCFDQAWLLFYANGAFSTLPTQGLDSEALEFIKSKVTENGGKVS